MPKQIETAFFCTKTPSNSQFFVPFPHSFILFKMVNMENIKLFEQKKSAASGMRKKKFGISVSPML